MPIERLTGGAHGRSRATIHDGQVYTVATAPDTNQDLAGQTVQTLAALDQNLADAGTDKSRILSANVYVVDIAKKDIVMTFKAIQWIIVVTDDPADIRFGTSQSPVI